MTISEALFWQAMVFVVATIFSAIAIIDTKIKAPKILTITFGGLTLLSFVASIWTGVQW